MHVRLKKTNNYIVFYPQQKMWIEKIPILFITALFAFANKYNNSEIILINSDFYIKINEYIIIFALIHFAIDQFTHLCLCG